GRRVLPGWLHCLLLISALPFSSSAGTASACGRSGHRLQFARAARGARSSIPLRRRCPMLSRGRGRVHGARLILSRKTPWPRSVCFTCGLTDAGALRHPSEEGVQRIEGRLGEALGGDVDDVLAVPLRFLGIAGPAPGGDALPAQGGATALH